MVGFIFSEYIFNELVPNLMFRIDIFAARIRTSSLEQTCGDETWWLDTVLAYTNKKFMNTKTKSLLNTTIPVIIV